MSEQAVRLAWPSAIDHSRPIPSRLLYPQTPAAVAPTLVGMGESPPAVAKSRLETRSDRARNEIGGDVGVPQLEDFDRPFVPFGSVTKPLPKPVEPSPGARHRFSWTTAVHQFHGLSLETSFQPVQDLVLSKLVRTVGPGKAEAGKQRRGKEAHGRQPRDEEHICQAGPERYVRC